MNKLSSLSFVGNTRKHWCVIAALALIGCSKQEETPAQQSTQEPIAVTSVSQSAGKLNIYNWADYIPEGFIEKFEQETGIEVVYDTFETNEVLQAKLAAGNTGYDIVVPTSTFGIGQLQAGFFQPLDKTKIPNLRNLDPQFMESVAKADPGNAYFVPWAWSFNTVGINKTLVSEALDGEPLPENSWELVFEPKYTSRLRKCGVAFLDSPTEIFPAMLHYLGKPPHSNNPDDIKLATEALLRIRQDLSFFSNALIDDLANRRACATSFWAGDISWSAQIAQENGYDDEIVALIPSTGGILFTDVMAIPADAKNVDNAHAFMNFYLDPANSAQVINEVYYHTGNTAALEFVDPELRSNTAIFVSDSDIQNMVPPGSFTQASREAMAAAFNRLKLGN